MRWFAHRCRLVPVATQDFTATMPFSANLPKTVVLWRCERCTGATTTVLDGRWALDQVRGTPAPGGLDWAAVTAMDRVLSARLRAAYDVAVAAAPDDQYRKGVEDLWQRLAGSHGYTWSHAQAMADVVAGTEPEVAP